MSVKHEAFDSLDVMLSVGAMSELEGRAIQCVSARSWTPAQTASGCAFLKVESAGTSGSRHYVVKRTTFETDIVRRLSDDVECRERLLWQQRPIRPAAAGDHVPDCGRRQGW
jgi:hypothetical protein